MGIINPDQHDVFISYASLDNALYRGWIKQFQTDLKERTHIELSDEGHKYDLDQLDFFFDQETMPANGEIAGELIDAIKISNFLIMFVGDHYLTSAYCARELEWFSSRFQTLERHALENMFMVVLTSAAVRQASEGTLGKIKAQAKYVPAFGKAENDGPHPKHLLVGVGDYMADNPEYIKLVDGVASTLAKRMIKKIPAEGSHAAVSRDSGATGGPGTKGKPTIAFGAVVRNMKDYRGKLAAKIAEAHSVRVDTLELDDFSGLTADEFKERLKEATMFVQLIDKSPCGFLGGQPGGFLAAQEKLVPPTLPILWITPKERSDVSPVEQDPQHLDYLNKVIAGARHVAEDEIVQAIGSEVQRRSGGAVPRAKFARIMIEHSDQDQDEVANVRGIVDKAWAAISPGGLGLRFRAAEWDQMKNAPELLEDCHGIVVVDRSKPLATMVVQMEQLEDELARRNRELAYRTFVLPPKSKATVFTWPQVLFKRHDTKPDVEVITLANLEAFLRRVKEKALEESAGTGA